MKFREIYFHTVAIALGAGFLTGFSGVASAQQNDILEIRDHYKTVIQQNPYKVEVCRDVVVSGDKTGDTLKGAIIGGIIGNNVGDIENGGAAGAIIGGLLGHQNSTASGGTKRTCSIETRYQEESLELYSHSSITFLADGKQYTVKFSK